MTELAFIVNTSDTALPAGHAATSVSIDSEGASSFSGLLGERMQSGLARPSQAGNSPSKSSLSDATVVAESGVAEPLDGKPLPLTSAEGQNTQTDSLQAGLVNAAFLTAVTQNAPRNAKAAIATAADSVPAETPSDGRLPHLTTVLAGALNTLGEAVRPMPTKQSVAAKTDTMIAPQSPLANLAKQLMLGKSGNISAEKQAAHQESGRALATTITPALLAQPVSESAQRALVLAMKEAGLAKSVAPNSALQTDASRNLNTRPPGSIPLPTGLMSAMHSSAISAKTAANAGFDANAVVARLAQQSATNITSTAGLTMVNSASDAGGLLPVSPSLNTAGNTGFMPTMSIATPVGQSGWANEMGQRVAWMVQGELREAQLQLHPRSLGPVEVRIAYGHEQQLNVSFTAANPLAREALDAALPRLREMFEQQGLDLADANISQHAFSDQQHGDNEKGEPGSLVGTGVSDTEGLTENSLLSNNMLVGDGLLDAYA